MIKKKQIDYLLYGGSYLFRTKILKQEIPFIGGLVINEKCNLSCKQCKVANRDIPDLTYEDANKGLKIFYNMGIRTVFIEGGEPFLWSDRDYRLEDIIQAARKIGFKVVSVYTNGTLPINTSADTIFVSLDGLRETNNSLRGNVYDRVIHNIEDSKHPNIIINFTINSANKEELEAFCDEIQKIDNVKGIFFYFHTPYYGMDNLFIPIEEKRIIIKRVLELKKRKHRIFNSTACLKSASKDTWKRPSKLCYVYANNELYQCCRAVGNKQVCENCGYLGYTEIIHILQLQPTAILESLNYLPKG